MTPDIQELKRLAEAARDAKIDNAGVWAWVAFHEASTPSTILALIEAVKRQREAFSGPAAWLDSWAQHVGNCKGGCVCTCGLTLARTEAAAALKETGHE